MRKSMNVVRIAAPAFVVFFLLTSIAASAADLFGGPLEPDGSSELQCRIVNVGNKSIDVFIETFDGNGNLINNTSFLGLVPLRGTVLGTPAANGPRVCRFFGDFSKNEVRATVSVVERSSIGAIAAVEAN